MTYDKDVELGTLDPTALQIIQCRRICSGKTCEHIIHHYSLFSRAMLRSSWLLQCKNGASAPSCLSLLFLAFFCRLYKVLLTTFFVTFPSFPPQNAWCWERKNMSLFTAFHKPIPVLIISCPFLYRSIINRLI